MSPPGPPLVTAKEQPQKVGREAVTTETITLHVASLRWTCVRNIFNP